MSKANNLGDFIRDIADAVRTKESSTDPIPAQNLSSRIRNLPQPTGTFNIVANGTYDITDFASVHVEVSGTADIIEANIQQMQTTDLTWSTLRGFNSVIPYEDYEDAEEYFQELASAILGVENE